MKLLRAVALALAALAQASIVGLSASPSDTPPQPSAAQKQVVQERVRAMARQLVAGVLDVQMTQLKENGLQALPLFAEIVSMRRRLDELVDRDMADVVTILSRAEAAPVEKRDEALLEAHRKSRAVVVAMLVERQNLLRRLRIAEIAEQVRRAIAAETAALTATADLPNQPQIRRETLALRAIEDQRDVAALYAQFKDALGDVSKWPGEAGVEARQGLRLLETGRVDAELDAAQQRLSGAQYREATVSQEAVIRGLSALLAQLNRTPQKDQAADRAAASALEQLATRQEELRDAAQRVDLQTPEADKLVNQQTELAKRVAEAARDVQTPPAARAEVAKAHAAAQEAAAKLFEQKREEAVAEQTKAIEQLRKAASQAEPSAPAKQVADATPPTEQAIKDLEAMKKDVEAALGEHERAAAAAKASPDEARQRERAAAEKLARAPQGRQAPQAVQETTREAERHAQRAATAMEQPAPVREQTVRRAEQASELALAEIERALGDARRAQLAARRGTLEQAARDLHAAAAAEREVAKQADAAAKAQGMEKPQAEQLAKNNAEADRKAAAAAEKLSQELPRAAETAADARRSMWQAGERLEAAAKAPGKPSKPQVQEAARHAEQAAGKLTQAAKEAAEEAARTTAEASKLADAHLDQVKKAEQAVERQLTDALDSAAKKAERLEQAKANVSEAQAAQRAARPKSDSSPPNVLEQAKVGPKAAAARELARDDAPQAAQSLARAEEQSAAAMRSAERGERPATKASQEGASSALDEAAERLAAAQERLAAEASGQLGRQAEQSRSSGRLAVPVDPTATEALHTAENEAADGALKPAAPQQAAESDRMVQQALEQAAASLAARRQAIEQAQQSARQQAQDDQPGAQPQPDQKDGLPVAKGGPRPIDSDARSAAANAASERAAARVPESDPWFAKLPPEVRKAMRTSAASAPPRGYEERMQRYFQNRE